jgi:hypothetical protein
MKVAAFLALPAALYAQTGGIVEGTISNRVTHAGVPGVVVKIVEGVRDYRATTSDSGTFRIVNIAPGQYSLSFDSKDLITPEARRLQVTTGDPVRIDVELAPWGKIRGRVLDDQGKPAGKLQIGMMRYRGGGGSTSRTESDGSFTIQGMGPGAYVLQARPAPGSPWAPTYFPNGSDRSEAQPIVVREGADLLNYEIRLRAVPLYRLSGVALDEQGHPFAGATLKLIFDMWIGPEAETKSGPDGAFEFQKVRPGDWRIKGEAFRGGYGAEGAATGSITNRDVEDVRVRLNPPFALSGFVERDEPRDAKGERKVTGIFLEGVDGVLSAGVFHGQTGTFLMNAFPGRYRIVPRGFIPGYYLDSILLGEQDVLNQEVDLGPGTPPLRIIYRSKAGKVRGTVENCGGAAVYILPQDEAFLNDQFIRSGRCDANGRFEIDSLRPGSYYAFAFDRVEGQALADAAFVRGLAAQAETFQVKQGETASVTLKVTPWPE